MQDAGPARPGRRRLSGRARSGRSCRTYPGPRLMSINGDEGEPGTFKDRVYLERDPHRTLEGALIAAHGRRGRAHLLLYARRVSARCSPSCAARSPRSRPPASHRAGLHRAAARRRRLYLRRRERDDREHRGQARPAAPSPALYRRGRAVRPPDARITMSRRCGGCATSSRRARNGSPAAAGARPSGPAVVVGVRAGQGPRRQAGAGRRHRPRADRQTIAAAWRTATRFTALSAGRRLGRHPAGVDGRHSARFRRRARQASARSSARMRW